MDHDLGSRRLKGNSILHKLCDRETIIQKPNAHHHLNRQFYTNILPNYTLIDVEKPPCFLRKFSPNGHYFIAFSSDQASIEIYEFQGPAAAADLLTGCPRGEVLNEQTEKAKKIRTHAFNRFFKLKHVIVLASGHENLNRECSLFTDNSRYVIVGSAAYVPTDPTPTFHEVYRNNEAVFPNEARSPLENYTLYIVDLECGVLCDTRHYLCDKIFLSHNQGLYLYNDTLAVLSVQQQIVHVLHIQENGELQDVRAIGRFCFEDDEFYFSLGRETPEGQRLLPKKTRPVPAPRGVYTETMINSLKHRLLTHMYKLARAEGPLAVRRFCCHFDQFRELRIWKMQLVDETHLLIKYGTEHMVTQRALEPNSQPAFFVLYNIVSAEVVKVWENSSDELLDLFEVFSDQFRNVLSSYGENLYSSACSNIYSKQIQARFKQTIINARFGGHTEAVKRILTQLPISAQSYSCSPYLDLSLFSYDDKWVSVMERPKTCGDYPIRFYGRQCNLLKFKIHTGSTYANPEKSNSARKLVAFTFHPSMPFAISVQRKNSAQYIVNLHVHHMPA